MVDTSRMSLHTHPPTKNCLTGVDCKFGVCFFLNVSDTCTYKGFETIKLHICQEVMSLTHCDNKSPKP